jgi:hypothetical protein
MEGFMSPPVHVWNQYSAVQYNNVICNIMTQEFNKNVSTCVPGNAELLHGLSVESLQHSVVMVDIVNLPT